MKRAVGLSILGLSASGYPLTQILIGRWGRRGAIGVESVCIGLVARDASLVAAGVGKRLCHLPTVLLYLELAAGIAAALAGLHPLLRRDARSHAFATGPHGVETVRRLAVATLFGLHTVRFAIYLRPDQGRRIVA